MKRYILFGLSLLMAFPLAVSAQDDDTEEGTETQVRGFAIKQKKYETRDIAGRVVNAATHEPVSGAIIHAAEIEGYSTLSEDDGSFVLKVPVFATALYVVTPDFNPVRMGLTKDSLQRTIMLYPTTFDAEYSAQTNVRSDASANDFKYTNAINIKDEIQKQLGAQVHTTGMNGTPGVGSVMFIQGLNSLNANAQPLIVVDDVVFDMQYGRSVLHDGFYNDVLSNINPNDIEKVTVLRNGTALYGAKGANGVILIQTKRSKSMATRITASASAGVTFKPRMLSVMDAEQYRGYASELLKTTNTRLTSFKFLDERQTLENGKMNYYYPLYHQNTDWKNLVYRSAISQNYGINIEGGDNVANYNLSIGYTSAKSTLKYNDMDRLSIRFNTDINLFKRLSVRFDASFSNQTRDLRDDGAPQGYDEGTPSAPSFLAYAKSPFLSPYSYGRGVFSDEKYDVYKESYLSEALANYKNYNWQLDNPVLINEDGEAPNKNRFETSQLNLSVTPKFKFNSHLSLSEHFSYNLVNTNEMYYIPRNGLLINPNDQGNNTHAGYYVSSLGGYRDNEVRSLAAKQNSVMSDTRLEWGNRYDAHVINVFGGVRINWENYTSNQQVGYNTGNDKTPFMRKDLANVSVEGINESWRSMAMYVQGEYNWMSRYYVQANLTLEGSSRFGKDAAGLRLFKAPWAVFPGIQASWVLTNESWLSGVNGLDHLRLNVGFDMSGNDDINFYAARSYFASNQFLHSVAGLSFEGIGNTKIQWETTRRLNASLEGNFINNRLNVAFHYFNSWTNNLLTLQSVNFLSGLEKGWSNGGKLTNQGFDVTVNAKVLNLKDWQWQVGASVGHYKNKITELPEGNEYIDNQVYGATVRTQVGQAANLFYGYKALGVFATTEEAAQAGLSGEKGLFFMADNGVDKKYFGAGDIHFADLNGDGQITDADRTVIGDPNPDIFGNIFTSLAWKRFRLDVRFNYSLGNDVFNYMRAQLESGSRFMNQTTALNQRWQVEGQQTSMPRITFQDPMGNARFSDRWIEDGSYLRLKTVTLSYNLPLKSKYIQGLQFWVQGNNLFTVTKYLGSDPEFSMTSSVIGQGIDLGRLGQGRSVVAGVKINL
jgi:TonB-linked SusC/RagA family outer membrane protein